MPFAMATCDLDRPVGLGATPFPVPLHFGHECVGEVLAVGPGRRSEQTGEIIPLDVKVGDTVVYSKYGGTEITDGGEDLLILNGRDVLAIVK